MPKHRRRGKGEGSVYERQDGRWEFALLVGYTPKGNPKRIRVYGRTQGEVLEKAAKLKGDFARGLLAEPNTTTFKEFADKWLERKVRGKAANTKANYEKELKLAYTHLGHMRLQAIKPTHIRGLLDALHKDDYAPRTIKKVLERLRAVFRDAVKLEVIYRNPAEYLEVDVPPSEPVGKSLQPAEVEKLLEVCDKHRMGFLFRFILATGLRKAEALALTWADVDLERKEVVVTKGWTKVGTAGEMTKTKTRSSKRKVPLEAYDLVQHLQKRKADELALLEKDPGWAVQVEHSYIFNEPGGLKPIHPNTPNRFLNEYCDLAEIPRYRVHDLRHTFGTFALRRGIRLEVVSKWMGHADPSITLKIYSHVLEDESKESAEQLKGIFAPPPKETEPQPAAHQA